MRSRGILAAAVLALGLVSGHAAHAATITIINNDGAGEGFNDPTGAAPVGGNPGVTIGQQRLNVFQEAATIWGSILPSCVTIQVQAQFIALSCSPTSAVLGSAGPVSVAHDFGGGVIDALTGLRFGFAATNEGVVGAQQYSLHQRFPVTTAQRAGS